MSWVRGHDRPERRDERLGVPREDGIGPHGDDIFDAGGLQVVKDLRRRKAGIEADAQLGAGKGAPEFREQPPQEAHRPAGPRRVARAEDRRHEVLPRLAVKGQAGDERQIAPVIIEAIEEGELLRAVGLVFGDIEIDRNEADAAPPSAMPRNHRVGERVPIASSIRGAAVCSKREMVGCDAKRPPAIGSRPSNSLWIGSSARRSASLPSGWPHAIAKTRCASRSPTPCVTRADARASGTVAVRAASRPSWRSAALSRIAPPSELAWG